MPQKFLWTRPHLRGMPLGRAPKSHSPPPHKPPVHTHPQGSRRLRDHRLVRTQPPGSRPLVRTHPLPSSLQAPTRPISLRVHTCHHPLQGILPQVAMDQGHQMHGSTPKALLGSRLPVQMASCMRVLGCRRSTQGQKVGMTGGIRALWTVSMQTTSVPTSGMTMAITRKWMQFTFI